MKATEMPVYRLTSNCIWNSFQSSHKKHLIITGDRGVGKSTLLNRLFPNPLPGITTWAVPKSAVFFKENVTHNITQVGVYDAALEGFENKMKLCGDGFENLGINALNNASSNVLMNIPSFLYLWGTPGSSHHVFAAPQTAFCSRWLYIT